MERPSWAYENEIKHSTERAAAQHVFLYICTLHSAASAGSQCSGRDGHTAAGG